MYDASLIHPTLARELDNGKTVQLTNESEPIRELREVIKTEHERMKIAAQERGLQPHQMSTWKNVDRLIKRLEEILNS